MLQAEGGGAVNPVMLALAKQTGWRINIDHRGAEVWTHPDHLALYVRSAALIAITMDMRRGVWGWVQAEDGTWVDRWEREVQP